MRWVNEEALYGVDGCAEDPHDIVVHS
ncbi:unnamed protein product [Spirodela intermedia]|uniref:Uncharacterized protein n=2 Tax=Spirodela intermedia TaxID=51605 RepID=A0A7I8LL04_SPIIN|nr:unnamed protein product [Spirodela intermedia]CAA7410480.1 unnamed protein product [Spirodela intermedia]